MSRVLLLPGDLICDAVGIPAASDHRVILRSFLNIAIWGAASMAVALKLAL